LLAIEVHDGEGQKTREGTSKRGDTEHQCKAELQNMTFVKRGKEEHNSGKESTLGCSHSINIEADPYYMEHTLNNAKEEPTGEKTVIRFYSA
jgi:hypothetical protein